MDRDEHAAALTVAEPGELAESLVRRVIPSRDMAEFYSLTARNQARIVKMLEAVAIIESEPVKMLAYDKAAQHLAGLRGASASRLRVLYSAFRQSRPARDWRVFIDDALEHQPKERIPAEFLSYLQERVDANKRSRDAALKMIRVEWLQGASMPGYGTWKDWWKLRHPTLPVPRDCPGHPAGWTLRNLRRKLDASAFRRKAQTIGLSAAASLRPMVYTTRAGLWVGSHYQFDDVWHDHFVTSLTEGQAGRPLELFAHDLFSARKIRWGCRIRTEDDNGKARGLTMRMMRMILAATLACDGYSPRGTVFIAEHGTAAIPDELEALFHDATGGLITVSRSGMQGAAAHAGQYGGLQRIKNKDGGVRVIGATGGNPRHKASLESSNNLVHNLAGALPGQTGRNRESRPEQLAALLKYNDQLLAASRFLPPSTALLLAYPLLTESQNMAVLSGLYAAMDEMRDHNLEGWEAAGNMVAEAQFLGAWLSQEQILALPAEDQEHMLAKIANGTAKVRTRRMSRGEVWQRGCGDLVRMSGAIIHTILGEDFHAERPVKGHKFEFEDRELGPGVHRYDTLCTPHAGEPFYLRDGDKYRVSVNPFAPDALGIFDAKGRFLGECQRIQAVNRHDITALNEAFGRVNRTTNDLLEPLRKRAMNEARERLALMEHNNALIEGHNASEHAAAADALGALASVAAAAPRKSSRNRKPQTNNNSTADHGTEPQTSDW